MKKGKIFIMCFLVLFLTLITIAPALWAEEQYRFTFKEVESAKALLNDPKPLWKNLTHKNMLPPDVYAKLTYDEEKMKALWAELVGFRAPDLVGKIAPEIKPGTYTYKDKEKYPFKELMIPEIYNRFNPGGTPFGCNFPEIKVVPTRQYYWALPIAEATKKYMGRTKLNDQGYIIWDSYVAGYPFPKPSGKLMAQEIMYNWEKRYYQGESAYGFGQFIGITKGLSIDSKMAAELWRLRLTGRVMMQPYGWYDKRSEEKHESYADIYKFLSPRDMAGSAMMSLNYVDPEHLDLAMIYIGVLRRVRQMSTSDTQDTVAGQDNIYDDRDGFAQKINPKVFPYKYELIGEREYLVPFATTEGAGYVSTEKMEARNYEFERRPTYVLKLTQLDRNYVYGQRILYIDKETFNLYFVENYDQKGRLYRTALPISAFFPEMGIFTQFDWMFRDHLDLHTTFGRATMMQAPWLTRDEISLKGLLEKGK
jgi:hypothetical protein